MGLQLGQVLELSELRTKFTMLPPPLPTLAISTSTRLRTSATSEGTPQLHRASGRHQSLKPAKSPNLKKKKTPSEAEASGDADADASGEGGRPHAGVKPRCGKAGAVEDDEEERPRQHHHRAEHQQGHQHPGQ